jgi:hypothetical protein
MRAAKLSRPPGRPPADTELVAWNIPRATVELIRAECQRLGCNPGQFVSRVVLTRYFSCPKTEQTDSLNPSSGRI